MEQIEQCSNPLCYWDILGYIGVLNSIKPSTNSISQYIPIYSNISQYIPVYINDILSSIIPETNHQPTGVDRSHPSLRFRSDLRKEVARLSMAIHISKVGHLFLNPVFG